MTGGARVVRLGLDRFRSYESLDLRVSGRLVALSGENGAGKTNLLEALSLLAPGRGLRRAELPDMARAGGGRFAVSLTLDGPAGEHRLGIGLAPDEEGRLARLCRIDGAPAGSAAAFSEHLRVVWLTPDLDGLFRGSPGERRRFLDRLVLAVDARHAARVSALDRALRSRNRLLSEGGSGGAWLDAIERELAELAVAVASARAETVSRLDAATLARAGDPSPFPFARVSLVGEIDDLVAGMPALDAEDRFRALLRANRARDAAAGRALSGPQASDLAVLHGPKDQPASVCSTGEQKALLIGLVLAHAGLVRVMTGVAPLLLLDEVAAHLDGRRRAALFADLAASESQVWMTGADGDLFRDVRGEVDRLLVTPGRVEAA